MSNIHPETMSAIIKALDEGVSPDVIATKFPEHRAAVAEVEEMRKLLLHTATVIPEPVTKAVDVRLSEVQGPVESPFVINLLFSSMNYKVVVPVVVIGLLVVGGAVFFGGKHRGQIAEAPKNAPVVETGGTPVDEAAAPTTAPSTLDTPATSIATNGGLNDVLVGFSDEISSEQVAYADDDVGSDLFAQSELSGFETEAYDY